MASEADEEAFVAECIEEESLVVMEVEEDVRPEQLGEIERLKLSGDDSIEEPALGAALTTTSDEDVEIIVTSGYLESSEPANYNLQCHKRLCSLEDSPTGFRIDATHEHSMKEMIRIFDEFNDKEQVRFAQELMLRMCHHQHGKIQEFLQPMLQRDFISQLALQGYPDIAINILSFLDAASLARAQLVCRNWYNVILHSRQWKRLIEYKVRTDELWSGLSLKLDFRKDLFKAGADKDNQHYMRLYPIIMHEIEKLDENWTRGSPKMTKIECHSETSKGVYCLQYDDDKIVSGLRDNTIKIWNKRTLECTKVLRGHNGSVLCLQYDDKIIISGSSDATVRVWNLETGDCEQTLIHHIEAVLHLRFADGIMVTCSKDRSIAVWDMASPRDITMRRVLVQHRAAVNVVDFDQKYIVSASGDRTIKVWNTSTCEFVRTLTGHKRGIACLQYRERLVVSGSSDYTIRLWDVECGQCLRVLEGHEELVRCIRFDSKRIVSGAYDGSIKIWDLKEALEPRSNSSKLCIRTLSEHTGRVFRLQFDDFQIVSSSHDDSICTWDFLAADSTTAVAQRLEGEPVIGEE